MKFAALISVIVALICNSAVFGQSFSLDDNPAAPISPAAPVGLIPGLGAEDPFGLTGASVAPSPTLGPAFLGGAGAHDGAILGPGPFVQHPGPLLGFYLDSLSSNHRDNGAELRIDFSVDRLTGGAAGTGTLGQASLGQAAGDIFTSTHTYVSPGTFAGTLAPPPGSTYAGVLPAIAGGTPGNVLTTDDSAFGLLLPTAAGGVGVAGPGVSVPFPGTGAAAGFHDNIDAFDHSVFDADGDSLFDTFGYFTVYPDDGVAFGVSAADIFSVPPGSASTLGVFAPAGSMGLDTFGGINSDSIDGLVMFDNGMEGEVEAGLDYALFSLAPGSATLAALGAAGFATDASDVFFTDFTGAFALYSSELDLGLFSTLGGLPPGNNIDALEISQIPEPATYAFALSMLLAGACGMRRRKRRVNIV